MDNTAFPGIVGWSENNGPNVSNLKSAEKNVKMLKWIKVRQSTSATTSKSTTPTSSILHQETKNDETRNGTEGKIEEEEDSGMEKEDSVCNVKLSHLKKVCSFRYRSFC